MDAPGFGAIGVRYLSGVADRLRHAGAPITDLACWTGRQVVAAFAIIVWVVIAHPAQIDVRRAIDQAITIDVELTVAIGSRTPIRDHDARSSTDVWADLVITQARRVRSTNTIVTAEVTLWTRVEVIAERGRLLA